MVRRRSTKRRVASKGARGFKKCVVSVIRKTKFKTPKQARKAFAKASKVCRAKAVGKKTSVRKTRRKTGTRKCKYGHLKGSKRCRKTPRRR